MTTNAKQTATRRNQTGQGRGISQAGKTLSGGAYAERQYATADDVELASTLNTVTATARTPQQTWTAGAQWALKDQGNELNIYHRDAIDERYRQPKRPLTPREEWIRGALWALRNQGNTITVYLEDEVTNRCPVSADKTWAESAHTVTDSPTASDEGTAVPNDTTTYAFCETASAYQLAPNHVRPLTAAGLKPSGGADTAALCGAQVAWDTGETTLDNAITVDFTCRTCKEKAQALV
ncbi:hypothetical protein ACWGJ9_10835 [Curtobacterium citreum]